MFVYVIVNSETLKIYVGQHKGINLRQYLQQKLSEARRGFSGRSRLYASMRKHPRDRWSIWPLVSGIESKHELDEIEKLLICALKAQHPDIGYNICRGGEGHTGTPWNKGTPRPIATRRKIHRSLLGNKNALGCKHGAEAIARTQGGKNHSPEWREKQRIAHQGQRTSLGQKRTTAQRELLRQTHIGKPWSAARRAAQEQTS